VREPRDALEAARRAAAEAPAVEAENVPARLERPADMKQLLEWAMIEPDPSEVYSTRRLGRPITALKHLLIRLLYQYLGQISAQQSRFNAHLAVHVMRLEGRINELEEALSSRLEDTTRSAPDSRAGNESA
jgi:hypothetical protein